jgi:hypothetical protein
MLQWTCRLRDVLERERFHSRSSCLSGLRELEFSNQDTFPEGLRWENLVESLNDGCHCLHQDDGTNDCFVPAINPTCLEYGSIRALSGESVPDLSQRKFDVLWLSPTVFVSRLSFNMNTRNCFEYSICFQRRRHSKATRFHVYLLSCFEKEAESATSSLCPLPLSFFRSLVADLPADYFARIFLRYFNPQPGAGNFYTQFLSVIRCDAPLGATAKGDAGRPLCLKVPSTGTISV